MTDNSESSPKLTDKLKSLMIQGTIGVISLTGASIIPIVVQRFLPPPTPAVSPVPATTVTPVQAEVIPSAPSGDDDDDDD